MESKRIIVIGLGLSGRAAVKLAARLGCTVTGIDEKTNGELTKFSQKFTDNPQVSIQIDFKRDKLPPADLIIMSPGINDESKLGKMVATADAEITSELDFAARFITKPILAVTGTNGKTTVTEMTTEILTKAGLKAIAAGNIGLPLSDLVGNDELNVIVVETSSFQLEKAEHFAPLSAALLNIESDHMDRYQNLDEYADTKFKIFANIPDVKRHVLNHCLLKIWKKNHPDKFPLTFSATDQQADIVFKKQSIEFDSALLCPLSLIETEISSRHNIENLMASIGLASVILDNAELQKSTQKMIRDFRISAHRQEVIAEKNGVIYVNDSKATNPSAMIAALNYFGGEKNICLIAGGLDKKMDFSPIKSSKDKIKAIFLAGESKNQLASLWNDDIHCIVCDSFEESVNKAASDAEPGDVVLLSPGCASMDMFANYKERGEKFRSIILSQVEKI